MSAEDSTEAPTRQGWCAYECGRYAYVFISALLIGRIRASSGSSAPDSPGDARAIFRQLGAGLRLIVHTRALPGILVVMAVTMLGLGAVNQLFVPLMVNELKVPTTWFGALEFAQTAGIVLSGSLVALLAARSKPTWIVCVGAIALGVAIGLLSLVASIWHVLPMLFIIGGS